jgi:hypothetical protein
MAPFEKNLAAQKDPTTQSDGGRDMIPPAGVDNKRNTHTCFSATGFPQEFRTVRFNSQPKLYKSVSLSAKRQHGSPERTCTFDFTLVRNPRR